LSVADYNKDKRLDAGAVGSVKEARMLFWYKLRDYGVEIKRYTFATAEEQSSEGSPSLTSRAWELLLLQAKTQRQAKLQQRTRKGKPAQGQPVAPIDLKASAEEPKTHPLDDFSYDLKYSPHKTNRLA